MPTRTDHPITLYVHELGDELWLFAAMTLLETASLRHVQLQPGVTGFADVCIRKSEYRMLNTEQKPCSNSPGIREATYERIRRNMKDIVRGLATCFLPEFLYLIDRKELGHLGDCQRDFVSEFFWVRTCV